MTVDGCSCEDCQQSGSYDCTVRWGDIVTVDLEMAPENGLVPEPLFDRNGVITFVVGWGNYLPALHEMVQGKRAGESFENISIDAGWGDRNPELVVELPKSKLQRFLQPDGSLPEVGTVLKLSGAIQLSVLTVNEEREIAVVDANPPLAGSSYECSMKILEINSVPADAIQQGSYQEHQSCPTRYRTATFALGCFWGGELAFMRVPGVVGTRVGYTQGTVSDPSYEEVCTGKTQHREAIMVVYDPQVVSYRQLMDVAVERLAATKTLNNSSSSSSSMFGNLFDEVEEETSINQQYCHGYYYHSEEQRTIAEAALNESNPYDIELKKAAVFYDAEESHQQYLLKGGQSARKGAKEIIRCYG